MCTNMQYSAADAGEGAWKQRSTWKPREGFPKEMLLELELQGQTELD